MLNLLRKIDQKLHGLARRLSEHDSSYQSLNPADYSTVDAPLEVPCQKEGYFFAINNYVSATDVVLDVGSGLGYGLNLLAIKAKEVHGVDIDERAINYSKEQLMGKNPKLKSLQLYDGYNLPYKDKSVDVITSIDVIEHVEDYDRFVKELMRVARKAVLFNTPNRRPEYTKPDGTPRNPWHLREWSYEELNAILKKHCKTIDWRFTNGPWEGPFTITKKVQDDTLVLMPILKLGR